MQRNTKERKERQIEFRMWVTSQLIMRNMTRVALAEELGIPVSRVCEAINGTGCCVKYIPMIINYFGGDEKNFIGLYDMPKAEGE